MPRREIRGALVALALVGAFGCTPADAARDGVARGPIVGGADSPHAEDAVIVLRSPGGSCSASLVAPNLVLTALHCVADPAGTNAICDLDGDPTEPDGTPWPDGDVFGADHDPHDIEVLSGGQGPTEPSGAWSADAVLAHGKRIFHAPDPRQCRTDLALVLLDRDVDDPVIAPLLLEAPPDVGDPIVSVGWGLQTGKAFATTRQARDVSVIHVGPAAGDFEGDVDVPPKFFSVGVGACSGDSGSPAWTPDGVVVGVASTLNKPNLFSIDTAADCKGNDVRIFYEATAAEQAVILDAFAAAGHAPWLAGTANPRAGLAGFGAPCSSDADCTSNACVPDLAGRGRCSTGCIGGVCAEGDVCPESACPDGYACVQIDRHDRCREAAPDAGTGGSSASESPSEPTAGGCGCRVGSEPEPNAKNWLALTLAAVAATTKRLSSRRLAKKKLSGDGRLKRVGEKKLSRPVG